jgi:hypothetical protein
LSVRGRSPLSGITYSQRDFDLVRFVDCQSDGAVAQVVTRFIAANGPEQDAIRDSLSDDDMYTLRAFSRRRAVSALRSKSVDLATQGVLAMALIDYARIDFRDMSVDLPHYALHKVGGDAENVLAHGAAISEPGTAKLFALASERAREPRSLAQCLELMVRSRYGLGLMETWGHRFDVASALPVRAIEMADLIDSTTSYETTSIVAGLELPTIWLEGSESPARIKAAAHTVQSCVSINADFGGLRFSGPRLLIFIAEGIENQHAAELAKIACAPTRSGQLQAAVAHGKRALILNAGSSRFGGTMPETTESFNALMDSLAASLSGDRMLTTGL